MCSRCCRRFEDEDRFEDDRLRRRFRFEGEDRFEDDRFRRNNLLRRIEVDRRRRDDDQFRFRRDFCRPCRRFC